LKGGAYALFAARLCTNKMFYPLRARQRAAGACAGILGHNLLNTRKHALRFRARARTLHYQGQKAR
jgi:hypothetical protein